MNGSGSRTLTVWWDDDRVGSLTVDQHGDTSFQYADTWLEREDARAISWSLPLQAEAYSRRESLPFFEGLLPEATQRERVAAALGVSKDNPFKLLELLGGDIAGALSLWPEGVNPPPETTETPGLLTDSELAARIGRLPERPLLAGESGARLSLAGAQAKLPLVKENGKLRLPAPGEPSTHILKPPIERFEGTTENEALVMRLAAAIGLPTASVEIGSAEGKPFLLVERYDRILHARKTRRIHQEDFCQAMEILSSRKYASEGGPGFGDCFALLRLAATRPAVEALKLLDAAIFNLLVGNADAHGKNYSLLYKSGETQLAPLYDLMATVIYPGLDDRLAMKIGGKAKLEEIEARHLDRFAVSIGMTPTYVRRRAKKLSQLVIERAAALGTELVQEFPVADSRALVEISQMIRNRAASFSGRL